MIHNDYIISSNNSMNENKYNNQKMKMSSRSIIKSLIKPLINIIKQNNNKSKTKKAKTQKSLCDCQNNHTAIFDDIYYETSEMENNSFNEELEYRIIDEIKHCQDNAAIYVYGDDDNCSMTPVFNDEEVFVPVHFARTTAGTFFWTTTQNNVDCDLVESKNCSTDSQLPQLQQSISDRWIQA